MNFNQDLNNLSFDLPKNQSNVIKVIGVGGGGSNAGAGPRYGTSGRLDIRGLK